MAHIQSFLRVLAQLEGRSTDTYLDDLPVNQDLTKATAMFTLFA